MAIRPDDVTVIPVGGAVLTEVAHDLDTPVGVFVQLRGVGVTCDSAELVLTRGGTSLTIATTIAAGEVTAVLTTANLATLGASIGDSLRGWFEGVITDGLDSHTWRFEMALIVSDRVFRFPFDYDELLDEITILGRACSVPSGQTSHWPQVRVGLRKLRDDINLQSSDVKTALLGREGLLKRPAQTYGTYYVLRAGVYRTTANMKDSTLSVMLGEWKKEKESCLSKAIASLRDSSDWQDEGTRGERTVKAASRSMGRSIGIGGSL